MTPNCFSPYSLPERTNPCDTVDIAPGSRVVLALFLLGLRRLEIKLGPVNQERIPSDLAQTQLYFRMPRDAKFISRCAGENWHIYNFFTSVSKFIPRKSPLLIVS